MLHTAAAILDFQKFEIVTVHPLYGANMRYSAKIHQNWWNSWKYGDLTVFQNNGRPHPRFSLA